MSILAWIVLGLIAGFISSLLVNRSGEGFLLDIVLGIVGAVVRRFIMPALGGEGVSGFNLYSILVAIGGAVVVLVILHAIRGTPRTGTYRRLFIGGSEYPWRAAGPPPPCAARLACYKAPGCRGVRTCRPS